MHDFFMYLLSRPNIRMANLDKFYDGIVTQDNRLRTSIHSQLTDFLQNPTTSCTSDNIDRIIDGLASWVNSSNFKVCVTMFGHGCFGSLCHKR